MILIPKALSPGDTVAITAASGPVNPEKLVSGVKILKNMGLRVRIMESCYGANEYLAATDEKRLQDLHMAFADKKIKGILVARGGYGAARLLPYLDFELIRQNPKIFAGYSDVTALHIAINQICQIVTYHAPMPAADFPVVGGCVSPPSRPEKACKGFSASDEITLKSYHGALFKNMYIFPQPEEIIHPGRATGILTGGNLSVMAASLGTPYEIETRGRILFMEEVGEPPYRIDRLFLQLKQAGKFSQAEGFVLGDFTENDEKAASPHFFTAPKARCGGNAAGAEAGFARCSEGAWGRSPHFKIKLAIGELLVSEGKPVVGGLLCGHCKPNITLPLGMAAEISTESEHPLQIYDRLGIAREHIRF